ncbi:MAG: FkbM family methyltransferase [Candidatus Didemnitutus sp.]|nr:FkbM family methyltransferase [Candidatus Didemnitutus sp.]
MPLADAVCAFFFRHRLRGAIRLHQFLLRGRRIIVRSKHGLALRLDPHDLVDAFVLRYGFYEEEVLEAALGRLRPGDVFWDIGANLGLHALTVKLLRPDVATYAFEPNPQAAALIRAASLRNALRADLVEIALDAAAGTADFYVHAGNTGRSSLHQWESDPALPPIRVSTATADGLVGAGRAAAPHVVKLDVEGNELHVLRGMRHLLNSAQLHTVIFEDSADDTSAVKQILRDAGFALEQLDRKEPTQHNLENYVARRERD